MDKIEKLQDDSLFMSKLEAMEWQEWEDKSIESEIRKESYTAGREQEKKEIILSMAKNNLPIETISKITNKTIKEINEIIKEN